MNQNSNVIQLQRYLDLGARQHVELLHAQNQTGVALASVLSGTWQEYTLPKAEALDYAATLPLAEIDSYVGQNGFRPHVTRAVSNLTRIIACYVDLDTYNTSEYADATTEEIILEVCGNYQFLPLPTIAGSSGRGVQLIWAFKKSIDPCYMQTWVQIQDALIEAFSEYGVDAHCKDAARVLRLSGTMNTKANALADFGQYSDPVGYHKMLAFLNQWNALKPTSIPAKGTKAKVIRLTKKNGYTLAYQRMQDLKHLATLRGGRLDDYRRRALFYFACSGSWFCHDKDQLQRELEVFIGECFRNPEKYNRAIVKSVLDRYDQAQQKITVPWDGHQVDPRYRYRTHTLINALDITPVEQQQLSVTYEGQDEKNRRRRLKRREQGILPRADYEAEAARRQQGAREMHQYGHSIQMIADTLGIATRTVYYYLSN